MKTAIYCRISTDKQSHASQLLELRKYCRRRHWVDTVEYLDTITGGKFTRRGLDVLFAEIRKGKIERLVVYKLDRLGRSLARLAQLVAELSANGTALICSSQGIDTTETNPAGRLQLGVSMAVAEFEKEIIRERVNAGLAAARARGAKLGRPEKLSRYRTAVRSLVRQGRGAREIARELRLPVSSAYKIVKAIRRNSE